MESVAYSAGCARISEHQYPILSGRTALTYHVQNAASSSTLNQPGLSLWMSIPRPRTRADEERSREVVSEDGRRQRALDVRNILQDSGSQSEALVHFQVVAVRPFASSAVAVVGVGGGVHVAASRPLEVGDADDLLEGWQGADDGAAEGIFDAFFMLAGSGLYG